MSDAPTLTKTLLNGVKLNCPSCGAGEIFASYLKRRDSCPHCARVLSASTPTMVRLG